ncbi:MAG: hypothetical protein AAFW75_12525 [Cyanobacteria bacterium J06636_16]
MSLETFPVEPDFPIGGPVDPLPIDPWPELLFPFNPGEGPFPVEPDFPIGGPVPGIPPEEPIDPDDGPFPVEPDFPIGGPTDPPPVNPLPVEPLPVESQLVDPGDTIPTATDTELSSSDPGTFTTFGTIGDNPDGIPELDVDFFQVQLDAGDQLSVSAESPLDFPTPESADIFPPPATFALRIFDEFGVEVASSGGGPFPEEPFSISTAADFIAESDGLYFIGVSGFDNVAYDPFVENSGFGFAFGDYTVDITVDLPPEPIIGTRRADILFGTDGRDVIDGRGGADTITGFLGNDELLGGRGNDFIDGGEDNDIIEGQQGDDFIFGGDGFDTIRGGRGADIIFGDDESEFSFGDDQLFGNAGNDEIFGGFGFDQLSGGNGKDLLDGGFGFDFLDGGAGDDVLIGVGFDEFGSTPGAFEQDTLLGGAGKDTFVLGNSEHVFYDDGDPSSTGEFDLALILDFDAGQDTVQLKGSADLYSLDFFVSPIGVSSAALVLESDESRSETIAIFENVAPDGLDLTSSAFQYV